MRLKLDGNLPTGLAAELTVRGHDADTVIDEDLEGQPDPVVVGAATDAGSMLVTLDRGIGDLRRYPPGSHAGVLVLRPTSQDPASVLDLVDRLLETHDWMTSPAASSSSSLATSVSDAQNRLSERYRVHALHRHPTR